MLPKKRSRRGLEKLREAPWDVWGGKKGDVAASLGSAFERRARIEARGRESRVWVNSNSGGREAEDLVQLPEDDEDRKLKYKKG